MTADIFNFHHYDNDTEVDLGREKLREHMLPGEVFITNATVLSVAEKDMAPRDVQEGSVSARIKQYEQGGRYAQVRSLDVAFDRKGNELPNHRAIVGLPAYGV